MSKTNSGLFFLQWVTAVTVFMTLAILAAFGIMLTAIISGAGMMWMGRGAKTAVAV